MNFAVHHEPNWGERLMKAAVVLAAALTAPLAVQAGVLESSPKPLARQHFLDIDFWGTISEVQHTPGRRVGDTIQGSFRINLGSTPENLHEGSAYRGDYRVNPLLECHPNCVPDMGAPHDFVTTRGVPVERGTASLDRVIVYERGDGAAGRYDQIEILDMWGTAQPGGVNALWESGLVVGSDSLNFIHGTGLAQQFDLRFGEGPGHTTGGAYFTEVIDDVWTRFWVTLDRVRATPRVCKP
jgi:hypothetical protein